MNNNHTTDKLPAAFNSLPRHDKIILYLVSIIYEPVKISVISHCLDKTDPALIKTTEPPDRSLSASIRHLQNAFLLNWKFQCDDSIVEILSQQAVTEGIYTHLAEIVRRELPAENTSLRYLRDVRIGLYTADFDLFNSSLSEYYQCPDVSEESSPLVSILNNPFDGRWFATLPDHLQLHGLHEILNDSLLRLAPCDGPLNFLRDKERKGEIPAEGISSFYYLLISSLLWRGETSLAVELLRRPGDSIDGFGLRGWLAFLQGKNDKAILHFENDLKKLKKIQGQRNVFFTGPEGLFFILALIKAGDYSFYPRIKSLVTNISVIQPHNLFLPAYAVLADVVSHQESLADPHYYSCWSNSPKDSLTVLIQGLAHFWVNSHLTLEQQEELSSSFQKARQNGYFFLAMEYAELLRRSGRGEPFRKFADDFRRRNNIISIFPALKQEERWQRALKALNALIAPQQKNHPSQSRLAWMIRSEHGFITITPKEQKLTAKGFWSKGRPVALQRLHSAQKLDFLTAQDRKIRRSLKKTRSFHSISYDFNMTEALPALIGHPHLFLADVPTVPVEFIKGEPELRVRQNNNQLHLEFFPDILADKVMAIRETPTRFRIIEISAEHRRIASIMGEEGLLVPLAAKEQVMQSLGNLSTCITIHSAIGDVAKDVKKVTANSKIIIHLLPVGTGFRLTMLVKPFVDGGPYLNPGKGSENIIAEIDGHRLQARRSLELEIQNCQKIESKCSILANLENTDWEWEIQKVEECLQLLQELREIKDEITVEWPEGEKLKLKQQVSFEHCHLQIRKKNNWFELQGELRLDDDKVLDMRRLLSLVRNSSGKFVPLEDGQYIALSREFRKQLEEINFFGEDRGKKIRLHPLAAAALENLSEKPFHLDTDQQWIDMLKRMHEVQEFQPRIPSTLQAQLRDYQIEGYQWLARLAHWGAGACLADDMGLGKTIQGLAVILDKAGQGPSLVVAPMSVCLNWQAEMNRFSPTLNVNLFGGKNRSEKINSLQPFDVVIVSYGLLQQETKLLTGVHWQVIILDEAQAIKNMATKRSKAAMSLQGEFKLITTGTPIENHLGELWNLFNFINPGLLGGLERFNKKYRLPIERYQDRTAQRKLKKLISPFILRRLKSQVLEELPPKTEITLRVEMSPEETAFYEALRREAVEKIEADTVPAGQKHMRILAELMRLRRACCHPKLVAKDCGIESSKLNLFSKVIDELLENRHKVLVFSQFVGHLSILRELLDDKKISYCYLDGSTTAKERKQQIKGFQTGTGDLFLISLKAGGLGLNLTAADYVIHMDPWWNPAVEDQASDRAHRIGQIRPVTIYRLVTKNTIEEKIVNLHQEKRTLADSLLNNIDVGRQINSKELLQLLRER